ncbi:pancreatic lipase-related protein 2-like [Musca domestica]|uniref:Pancreatic lipase-related protein 2-like n=1 Tax=Musca domestica TaxID=7370 RepID=A0ABM3VHS2_MUSDO|nr:pancreatic lipase-related protein 2-like [Musca domestica]
MSIAEKVKGKHKNDDNVNAITSTAVTLKRANSNAINAGCNIFGPAALNQGRNIPRLENVSFQLRTPCIRRDFPLSRVKKLREFPEFDVKKKTIVFVAGWVVRMDRDYLEDMATAFHCRGGNNFLLFNPAGRISQLYVHSAANVEKLGQLIAIGLVTLSIPPENIHLIGHSLGAHIIGSAGRYYQKLTGLKLARLTGLDPARPCFVRPSVFPRLRRSDAKSVDVIHSNPTDLGLEDSLGHIDFYAGGLDVIKAGCKPLSILCSHEISIYYFMETVYPGGEKNFVGRRCRGYEELFYKKCSGSAAFMGYVANDSMKGVIYTPVRDRLPYGLNAKFTDRIPQQCGKC